MQKMINNLKWTSNASTTGRWRCSAGYPPITYLASRGPRGRWYLRHGADVALGDYPSLTQAGHAAADHNARFLARFELRGLALPKAGRQDDGCPVRLWDKATGLCMDLDYTTQAVVLADQIMAGEADPYNVLVTREVLDGEAPTGPAPAPQVHGQLDPDHGRVQGVGPKFQGRRLDVLIAGLTAACTAATALNGALGPLGEAQIPCGPVNDAVVAAWQAIDVLLAHLTPAQQRRAIDASADPDTIAECLAGDGRSPYPTS